MDTGKLVQTKFAQALKTQCPTIRVHACPYPGHEAHVFSSADQLYDHVEMDHRDKFEGLSQQQAREKFRQLSLKFKSDRSAAATVGDRSAPDIAALTLDSGKASRQNSPPSGRKRPAEHDFTSRRGKSPPHVEVADPEFSRQIPQTVVSDRARSRPQDARLFDPKKNAKSTSSPYQTISEPSSEWSAEATKSSHLQSPQTQYRAHTPQRTTPKPQQSQRQPGLIELQRYDPRYPSLLLQPDSRPIAQEQLASEVESIYPGLTMVETRCMHVDRAQAEAAKYGNTKLPSDHWQALIALHQTLLREHHDFFLASQHPSASPALRRLAAKYSMPERMWEHAIYSFLKLLRRRLPDSLEHMLAFVYFAYQMIALFYETVPAFEDIWIECLGDLGRFRMAIEEEDSRDRETWASVARSWYTKAADKNPTVGRLYHHLAILARPNALQQMYYYTRSLTSVTPFQSARESMLTLLNPILGRAGAPTTHALAIDTHFVRAHGLQYEECCVDSAQGQEYQHTSEFMSAKAKFIGNLDNHIGRVTAKWKEQGVHIAVTNIAGWFEYGLNESLLRQAFLRPIYQRARDSPQWATEEKSRSASPGVQDHPLKPVIEDEKVKKAFSDVYDENDPVVLWKERRIIPNAKGITNETFALVLRRIGDKNVLPHVHIMLAFFSRLASSEHASNSIKDTPWAELVALLNALVKTMEQNQNESQAQLSNIDACLASDVFPADGERLDELPLPEDYLVRGLIWADGYFPKTWFERKLDEEERNLELASTDKARGERILRIAFSMAKHESWITYAAQSRTFAVKVPGGQASQTDKVTT